ncbi:hypothetical protein [Pseudoalteromonas lipolytica]
MYTLQSLQRFGITLSIYLWPSLIELANFDYSLKLMAPKDKPNGIDPACSGHTLFPFANQLN